MAENSEYYIRLGMPRDMQQQINAWCVDNADPDTGKVPSFSKGCRLLLEKGLGAIEVPNG